MPISENLIDSPRLRQQIAFITEMDRLKTILRRTRLTDASRHENTAEHSWHITLMAMVLVEYAAEPVNLPHVFKMVLVHDIVEIDAGDTFAYDNTGYASKAEREQKAADRLFGLLPEDQRDAFRALWDEFEEQQTAEAKFAGALDRLAGMLPNYLNDGGAWVEHFVTREQIIARNHPMEDGAPELWKFASAMIEDATARGLIPSGK